jgi:histidyl-tRNA synthetase
MATSPLEMKSMEEPMRCRGMRDLLPEDMVRFRRVEGVFRDVCLGWGYEEVRTPTLEHLHLFTAAGTLSPQMLGRVYSFLDWDGWSGERVVLRPDSTIPVARLYAEQARPGAVRKLFYVQNVLRFAQGDQSREDWQCGIELIGRTQPIGDLELIAMAREVLGRLGIKAEIKLSDPGILRAVLMKAGYDRAQQLELYDRVLDGQLTVLDEAAARIRGAALSLRSLLAIEGEGPAFIENLQSALLPSIPELERPFAELLSVSQVLLAVAGRHTIAPLLVRNFEYYTGPVFHFYADDVKIGGGGRYDGLIGLVGGAGVPAAGLALDIDAIAPLLDGPALLDEGRALVVRPRAASQADIAAAFSLAGALREAGRALRLAGAGEEPGSREIVAAEDGYTLRLNGVSPRTFKRPGEVLSALTDAGL